MWIRAYGGSILPFDVRVVVQYDVDNEALFLSPGHISGVQIKHRNQD